MSPIDAKPRTDTAPPPALVVWFRPSSGKPRVWRVVGTAATRAEALDLMNGTGDCVTLAPGVKPGGPPRG